MTFFSEIVARLPRERLTSWLVKQWRRVTRPLSAASVWNRQTAHPQPPLGLDPRRQPRDQPARPGAGQWRGRACLTRRAKDGG